MSLVYVFKGISGFASYIFVWKSFSKGNYFFILGILILGSCTHVVPGTDNVYTPSVAQEETKFSIPLINT